MSTIGGLFDPPQDLKLLQLSLQETQTHTYLTHTSFHRPPTTPTTKKLLYVPHLHFPWSSQLSQILYKTLSITLHPLSTNPPTTIPSTPAAFLPHLPPTHQRANNRTLHSLHTAYPTILSRIAIFVKLAYCNTLLQSLTNSLETIKTSLSTAAPTPQQPTKAIPTATRPGAAESGKLLPTRYPQQKPLPPPSRAPTAFTRISAHALPNHRGAPTAYLLHGVSVPSPLLPTTISLLRQYRILVHVPTTEPPATLVNLCSHSPIPRTDRRPFPGRGPRTVDDPVDAFVTRFYSSKWTVLCTAIIRQARVVVQQARITQLQEEVTRLEAAIRQCTNIRHSLIEQAIQKEVAGSSLLNMSAFAIAQSDDGFEGEYERFGRDCVKCVYEARQRIGLICAEGSRSAAVLVAGIRYAR